MKTISNQNYLIVGANGALAKETIKHLLKDGVQHLTMAVRTLEKGQQAKKEILSEVPQSNARIEVVGGFDMNQPEKIKHAVTALDKPFDVIFLAAGFAVFTDDYQQVNYKDKAVEKNVFQNLFGSHITLALLKEQHLIAPGARVVLAGGEGARGISGMIQKPVFNSPKELRNYIYLKDVPKYNAMNAIGASKFFGALWTKKMAQNHPELELIWFSPGLTAKSAGLQSLPVAKRLMMGLLFGAMNLLGKSQNPSEGGRKNADVLTRKIGHSGDLLGAPKGATLGKITDQSLLNSGFTDQGLIDELWKITQEVYAA